MNHRELTEGRHPIQVVARRTGLSAEVLRVWEKRYAAVLPSRTPTGRRLYSDTDLERLSLLRQATAAGRRIGEVSRLSSDELRALVDEDRRSSPETAPRGGAHAAAARFTEDALGAVGAMDEGRLEATLTRALLSLRAEDVVEDVFAPVLRQIGSRWREGDLQPYQEHAATLVIRRVLERSVEVLRAAPTAPTIALATPSGQVHDLGVLLAGLLAGAAGWRAVNLGADLPGIDVARGARRVEASVLALGITYPPDDSRLPEELRQLRLHLPTHVSVVVGGAAMHEYDAALQEIRAITLPDVRSLGAVLDVIRNGAAEELRMSKSTGRHTNE